MCSILLGFGPSVSAIDFLPPEEQGLFWIETITSTSSGGGTSPGTIDFKGFEGSSGGMGFALQPLVVIGGSQGAPWGVYSGYDPGRGGTGNSGGNPPTVIDLPDTGGTSLLLGMGLSAVLWAAHNSKLGRSPEIRSMATGPGAPLTEAR
jgi:hypothetical protein